MDERLQLLAQEHQTLVGLLKCPICLGMMINPVKTKCGHSFCKFCMEELLLTADNNDKGKKGNVPCPSCQTPGVTKRSLEPDQVLAQVVQKVRYKIFLD